MKKDKQKKMKRLFRRCKGYKIINFDQVRIQTNEKYK